MFDNKTILITGGTGSFGKRFVEELHTNYRPKKIIVYSRDELKQFQMSQTFPDNLVNSPMRYFIGDVRDRRRLTIAMRGADYVVHAAALKQVPATEYNPIEAVKTNILGAQNVIEAAFENGVSKVIALSTDKAAAPINLYGATKLTSDKLFIAANNYVGTHKIKFSVVRYGNVMGSRGSVIPFFLSLKDQEFLPITDKNMTRFNISLDEGVNFVTKCFDLMWGGELFVPKLPSYRILDVAEAIFPKKKIKIIGIRPGEKIHEEMITVSDAINTIEFKSYYVILPSIKDWKTEGFKEKSSDSRGKFCKKDFSYNSGTNKKFLSVSKIRKLIKENKNLMEL